MRSETPVMWNIVEEHASEAAFLWSQWRKALEAPDSRPLQVAGGAEKRLFAHLDALALNPPDALGRLLEKVLAANDLEKVFSLALALSEKPRAQGGIEILIRLLRKTDEIRTAAQAFSLCRRADLEPELIELLRKSEARWQAGALTSLAMRGQAPGGSLQPFLASRDPEVQAAALRLARFAGSGARALVDAAVSSPQPEVRDSALEAGLVLTSRSAYVAARRVVEKGGPDLDFPLTVLAMSGEPHDLDLIAGALAVPNLRRAALWALGISGWPQAADLCLPYLADEKLARNAGEAFSAITGLAIENDFALEEPPSPDEPIPFEEEDLEADLAPAPEDGLPLPDPDEIRPWWRKQRARFTPSIRFLGGNASGPKAILEALKTAPMRRRPPLALELAIRSRGEYQLETRSWVCDQIRILSERQLVVRSGFNAPFTRLLSD